MPKITIADRDGRIETREFQSGTALMFLLRDEAGLPVEGLCGGCASCGTCHVFVAENWRARLPAPQPLEQDMLDQLYHFDPEASRLSCQIVATEELDGLSLRLAPEE